MVKTATDKSAPKAEPKKRTILTPEQRLAKMEADLKAEREKIQAKAKAKLEQADARVKQLEEQVAVRQAKLDEAKAERDALRVQAGVPTEDETTVES